MKTWWLNLSLREKQTVSLGAVLFSAFIIYSILFAPLANGIHSLRQKIHNNQTLLDWMKASDTRITILEKTATTTVSTSSASLLSTIQNDISTQTFSKSVTALQQADNDSIQIRLQKISFDTLVKWLITICQEHHLLITQMTVLPSNTPGIVDADLKLQNS
jgi:type II secretory pathway component PulM